MTKQLEKFIDESTWTFAKTMQEEPHFYTVRSKENEEDFVALVQYIRANGYQAHYEDFPQEFTYLEYNGYRYWTMGNPISETTVINRCEIAIYKKIETSNGTKILLSDKYYAPWKKKLDSSDKFINAEILENKLFYQLEYIIEKVKDRKNIGLDLVDLFGHEDFIKLIHKEAESQLNLEILGRWAKCREIILISLSIIALAKYDGNFYEYVSEEYAFLYDHFSPQKIEGTIRTVLKWYCETEGVRKSNSRIINVALRNALVPVHFLSAYFEFIFDIYKVNFDCNLPEKLEEEFRFVYEGLRKNMLSSGDEIQINVTKKTYKLIETTKQLIAGGLAVDSIIELSIRIVQIIDDWYWKSENPIENTYFKKGYDEWSAKRRIRSDEKKVKRKSPELRSRWEPRYQMEGDTIYLVPPVHRVKAQYDYEDISICIRNQGKTIYYENAPYVKEIIGGYQISVDKIKLENPLGEIQYLLLAGQDEIYNSKEDLFRSFLVFNADGDEIHNNTNYNGTAIICTKPNMLQPYFSSEYYGLTDKNIHEGDFISVGKETFYFSSFDKPDVFGKVIGYQYLINKKSNEILKVFSRAEFLAFDAEAGGNYEVVINKTPHKLSDFHYKKNDRQNSEQIIISLDFVKPGINDITIYRLFQGNRKKVESFEFGYDPDFHKKIVKISDSKYSVRVSTAMCENLIATEIDVNNFSEDWLTVKWGEEEYAYLLPMPFTLYRIRGERWQPVWKDLWIDEISNESMLEVYGVEMDGLTVSNESGVSLQRELPIKNKKWYGEIAIGFLLSYKESNKYTKLTFLNAGVNKKTLYCYNQCVLNESMTEIMFNTIEKELVISPRYKGCGNVALEITEQDGTVIYFKEQLQSGEIIRIDGLRSFEHYQMLFFEKRKGLSLQKNRELMKKSLIVCSNKELCGRFFRIKEVQFDQMVHGKFLRKTHYFSKVYVYFSEQDGEGKFAGLIANKIQGKMYGLSNINPVEIELCGPILNSEMELSITKDADGLFLDFEHHGIKNTLEDNRGTDIFSYFIDMNGVTTS